MHVALHVFGQVPAHVFRQVSWPWQVLQVSQVAAQVLAQVLAHVF
jgi:hypothetical protein